MLLFYGTPKRLGIQKLNDAPSKTQLTPTSQLSPQQPENLNPTQLRSSPRTRRTTEKLHNFSTHLIHSRKTA